MSGHDLYIVVWALVSCGLLIYFLLCTIIFFQSRLKVFLYYGLYNIVLLSYVLTKYPFYLELLHKDYELSRYISYNWYSQIIFDVLLLLFYKEFLNLKDHFPKFEKAIIIYSKVCLGLASLFFIYTIVADDHHIFVQFFNFIFLPSIIIFTLYGLYVAYKCDKQLGFFIITGILLYNIFAFSGLYLSKVYSANLELHQNDFQPVGYFLIGILLESFVFLIGLGYKVKLLYHEKINSQNQIIDEQKKLQKLKDEQKNTIKQKLDQQATELKRIAQKTEEEHIESITSAYENEITILKLESLRSQMNPHFIFNALNSIKVYLIENEKEKAVHYLNKFSKLIRKILESSRTDSITLFEELSILDLYMSIENIRFNNEINVRIEIENGINTSAIKLPGLLLQPFIENALWHGLMPSKNEKTVVISLANAEDGTMLTITDNGIGVDKARKNKERKSYNKESLGLKFAQERLMNFNIKNGTNYKFELKDLTNSESKETGTEVRLYFSK